MKRENNPIRLPLETWCSLYLSYNAQHPTKQIETLVLTVIIICKTVKALDFSGSIDEQQTTTTTIIIKIINILLFNNN